MSHWPPKIDTTWQENEHGKKRNWTPTKQDLAQQEALALVLDTAPEAFDTVTGAANDTVWANYLRRIGCMSRCAGE